MSTGRYYSRIRVTGKDGDPARLFRLLHEFIDHPERADYVKEVVFRSNVCMFGCYSGEAERARCEGYEEEEAKSVVPGADKIRAALRCLDLNEEEESRWVQQLMWMEPELRRRADDELPSCFRDRRDEKFAQYAGTLLLMMCPNIEKLTYENNQGPMESVLKRNNYGLLPEQHLQELRKVTILPEGDEMFETLYYHDYDVLETLRLFHRLPSLEKLIADGVTVNNDAGFSEVFPPATSNVKKLRLRHTELPTSVLGPIIRMSKHLEELTFTEGGRDSRDGGHHRRYPKTIAQALACHKDTLIKLDLDTDEWYDDTLEDDRPDEGGEDQHMMQDEFSKIDAEEGAKPLSTWELQDPSDFRGALDLHEFTRLTHLSIGIRYLLGGPHYMEQIEPPVRLIDVLPPNLEYLLIRGYERGEEAVYDAEMARFASEKAIRLPALTEIQGADECIPVGDVDSELDDEFFLWKPKEKDESWAEVPADTMDVAMRSRL